jgi:acyl-ACP thioesterase
MEDIVPIPSQGRTFVESRRVRLTDMNPRGRLRLDAVARFLQEIAIDDVGETGWGAPDHLWFVRRMRVDVLEPFLADRGVELVTWCSGLATVAAGRRWSLTGDRGGRIEVDSVWIHLDADQRPSRITRFDAYARAAGGRLVSSRPQLAEPPTDGPRLPWPLRVSGVDLHGHVNNTVYWQAIEHVLLGAGPELGIPCSRRSGCSRSSTRRRSRRRRSRSSPRRSRSVPRVGREAEPRDLPPTEHDPYATQLASRGPL